MSTTLARLKRRMLRVFGALLSLATNLVVELRPLSPFPAYAFGDTDTRGWRHTVRRQLWRACRRFAPGQVRITQPFHGSMRIHQFLGTDLSLCLFVGGCYEPNEMAFVAETLEAGAVFVDLGANEGVFTLLGAGLVGRTGTVIAVEPSERERERLRDNLALNSLENVSVVDAAIDSSEGSAVLQIADAEHAGQNTLGQFVYAGVHGVSRREVRTTTLDIVVSEMDLTRVDLIKIDIEGGEGAALLGASTTLDRFHPVVLLELQATSLASRGSSVQAVLAELEKYGYEILVFDADTGVLKPKEREVSLNVVAIPRQHESHIETVGVSPWT